MRSGRYFFDRRFGGTKVIISVDSPEEHLPLPDKPCSTCDIQHHIRPAVFDFT
jgi:hypothetical protein